MSEQPTIVTATAVPPPNKGTFAGGNANGEVPVAYAQPYAVQDPYGGRSHFGHMSRHPGASQMERGGGGVQVQQTVDDHGRNVVTFATLYPDGAMGGQLTDREAQLIDCYRLARFIRNISILNIVLTCISGLFSYIWFILVPFPLCGYFGAKTYSKSLIYIYMFYLFAEIVGSIIWMAIINETSFYILRTLFILMNVFIIRYGYTLCNFISLFSDEDREFLMTNPMIQNAERSCC
jgi:hypothetical protein